MEGSTAQSDWDRLAGLQRALRSFEAGGRPDAVAAGERGVRLRLARLGLEEAIRADGEARARQRRAEFDRALAGIVERATLWAAAAPPPALPAAPALPARRAPGAPAAPPPGRRKAAAAASPGAPALLAPASAAPAAKRGPSPTAKPGRARRPKPRPAPPPEFWSPVLVLGFRMWDLRGRLFGAWKAWDRPEYEAACLPRRTGQGDDEVPHTDGRCGHPPCGLYCFKEPEQLVAAFGLPTDSRRAVAGLVALSGKVVEHEHGYRAKKARVLAAAVVGRGRILRVEGAARLQSLFAQPEATLAHLAAADPAIVEEVSDPVQMAESVIAYLGLARDFHLGPLN